jgi:hypothetical protein
MTTRAKFCLSAALFFAAIVFSVPAANADVFPSPAEIENGIEWVGKKLGVAKEVKKWVYSQCKTTIQVTDPDTGKTVDSPYPCGSIVYINSGAYTVGNVKLAARGPNHQPTGDPLYNPDCEAVSKAFTADLTVSQYDTFILPAACAYELTINIAGGPKKDRHYWLTPGCVIGAVTVGDIRSSSWDEVKSAPKADEGGKCGVQSDMYPD